MNRRIFTTVYSTPVTRHATLRSAALFNPADVRARPRDVDDTSVLLILPVYFLIATGIAAVVLFPAVRDRLRGVLRTSFARLAAVLTDSRQHTAGVLRIATKKSAACLSGTRTYGTRHHRLVAAVLIAIVLPPALAMSLRQAQHFDYGDATRGPDATTTAVLMGERLSPPPPLLPEAFTTREVELVRPRLDLLHASREWSMLDEDFNQRLLLVYKIMHDRHGYDMTLLEGYRSPARQAKLAALGPSVTGAGAYQSYHQYGLAADSAFVRDGKLVISEKDPWAMRGYALYGETAESVGLTWGGRWKLADYGHVELHNPALARQFRPPGPALTTSADDRP
jgi:peptidoglycan L-alanyl-D-glutamate endopeptidase CwlK